MKFTEKQQQIIDSCERLQTTMRTNKTEEEIDGAFRQFLDTHGDYLSQALHEYEDIYVVFFALATILENHIRKESALDVGVRMHELMEQLEDMKERSGFTAAQIKSIEDKVVPVLQRGRAFLYYTINPDGAIPYHRDPTQKCLLCKKNDATKTGSHLVSHFLIQRFFSYDGSSKRDKEVVESFDLTGQDNRTFMGHNVNADIAERLVGHELTDEEVEQENAKSNLLMRDYFFCPECEARFGIVESYYADILSGKVKDYPPQIPYLFWLSVVWRMSVGRLAIRMLPKHENHIRKALDKALSNERESIKLSGNLGHCAYRIAKADTIKDETPSIIGVHDCVLPYQMIIGDYVLIFSPNKKIAYQNVLRGGLDPKTINDGTHPEVISSLSFEEYWSIRRHIIDMNYEHPYDYSGGSIQDLSRMNPAEERQDIHDVLEEFLALGGKSKPAAKKGDGVPLIIPHAAANIMRAINKQEKAGKFDLQALMDETGYTKEEIEHILSAMFAEWEEELE